HGESETAARVGFAYRVVGQRGSPPESGHRGIPGDAELRKARGDAVEARVVVKAGAHQIEETVRTYRRPIAMHFQDETAARGLHAHVVLRRGVLTPESVIGIAQRSVIGGSHQRQ